MLPVILSVEELEKLRGMSHFDRSLYIAIREQMDFETRTVGQVGKRISRNSLCEAVYVEPVPRSKNPSGKPTIDVIRTSIKNLIKRGLLVRLEGEKISNLKDREYLVFFCPWAPLPKCAKNDKPRDKPRKNSDSSSLESFSQQEARALETRDLQGNDDDYDEWVSYAGQETNMPLHLINTQSNSNISESINLNSNTINHSSNLNIVDSINIAHFSKKNARFFTEEKFDQFWNLYPKKYRKDKKRARTAFNKYIKNEKIFLELLDGVRRRIEYEELCHSANISTQFWPNPPAYLNKERWNDQFDFSEVSNEINRRNTQTATGRVKNAFDNLRKVRGALHRRIDESK